jgi:hypothetical protein
LLSGLRFKIWDGTALSPIDQAIWDTARSQIPDWALLHRLELSDEDQRAREEAETNVEREILVAFFSGADEATVSEDEHGVQFCREVRLTNTALPRQRKNRSGSA